VGGSAAKAVSDVVCASAGLRRRNKANPAAEKLDVLKGHDFSRAVSTAKSTGPLGPEK
jgi:hypothetical protein